MKPSESWHNIDFIPKVHVIFTIKCETEHKMNFHKKQYVELHLNT